MMNARRPEGRPAAASITGFADWKLSRRAPRGALRRGALKDIHRYYVFHGLGANTLFMSVSTERAMSRSAHRWAWKRSIVCSRHVFHTSKI